MHLITFSRDNIPTVLMHHNETRGSGVGILDGNNSATWLIVRHVDDYCLSFVAPILSPRFLPAVAKLAIKN